MALRFRQQVAVFWSAVLVDAGEVWSSGAGEGMWVRRTISGFAFFGLGRAAGPVVTRYFGMG